MEAASRTGSSMDSHMTLVVSSKALPTQCRYYLLCRSGLRRHVQIIRVDPATGALKFTQTYGRDMFPTEAQALEFLRHEGPHQILATGSHVLGYVVVAHTGMLLLAEKTRVAATLPGNHQVRAVVTSKWHKIPLQPAMQQGGQMQALDPEAAMSPSQRDEYYRSMDKISTFPIDGAHYFCETIDITRAYPSYRPVTQPSWDFVWNRWLTTAFRGIGLDFLCPPLLQGVCEERALQDFDGAPYHLALISRRGRLHVGPRYKARGLNSNSEPGNEAEVEQVVWRRPVREGSPIAWSRYVWRRGSVPLWWGVFLKQNGLGEAEIKIKEQRTFQGSRRYCRRLQKRYCPVPHLDPDENATATPPTPTSADTQGIGAIPPSASQQEASLDPSLQVPLMFVSLLRKGTPDKDRSEAKLASAFDFVANALKKEHKMPLQYIALDWHEMDKQLGTNGIVEAFWNTVSGILPKHGFALGQVVKVEPDNQDLLRTGMEPPPVTSGGLASYERCTSPAGVGWQARWFRQQRGIARYNCADSLDRTNVGSFFGAVQVLVEQCRELDIAIAVSPRGAANIAAMKQRLIAKATITAPRHGSRTLSTLSQRPSLASLTPQSGGPAVAATGGSGMAAAMLGLDKFGKDIGKDLGKFGKMLQDIRSPKAGQVASLRMDVTPQRSTNSAADLSTLSMPHSLYNHNSNHTLAHRHSSLNTAGPASAGHAGGEGVVRPASPTVLQEGLQGGMEGPLQQDLMLLDAIAHTLPVAWEVKLDKANSKFFYVDHNTRTTHWRHPGLPEGAGDEALRQLVAASAVARALVNAPLPAATPGTLQGGSLVPGSTASRGPRHTADSVMTHDLLAAHDRQQRHAEEDRELWEPLSPWCMFRASVGQFGRRINHDALSALAEVFLVNGDMIAWLYTGSQAMHSERILVFEPPESKLRKASVGHVGNLVVGVVRRFNNVLVDADKQMQIEMFLGLKHSIYCPMTKFYYKDEGAVPLDYAETEDDQDHVGHIDWSADKMGLGARADHVTDQSGGQGHARHKSYSSNDLLWSQHVTRTLTPTSGFAAASLLEVPAVPILGHQGSVSSSLPRENSEGHMHKALSDPSILDYHSEDSSGLLHPVNSHMHPALGFLGSLTRSVSAIQLAPVSGDESSLLGPHVASANRLSLDVHLNQPIALPSLQAAGSLPGPELSLDLLQFTLPVTTTPPDQAGHLLGALPQLLHPLQSSSSWGNLSAHSEGQLGVGPPAYSQGNGHRRPNSPGLLSACDEHTFAPVHSHLRLGHPIMGSDSSLPSGQRLPSASTSKPIPIDTNNQQSVSGASSQGGGWSHVSGSATPERECAGATAGAKELVGSAANVMRQGFTKMGGVFGLN